MDVSVIIGTLNRASHLRKTLRSLANTYIPPSLDVELLVVDNGSTDETAFVVETWAPEDWPVRRVVEPKPGLSRARNRGVAVSTGRVLLYTDDDVRLPEEWVEPMAAPILRGDADAVAGGVELADALRRDWMTTSHTMLLADTEILRESDANRMVGANMAISREVFEVVPGFDPNLGPGRESTGFHEETLFSFQLQRAGFRLVKALDIAVEHHPVEERLQYSGFAETLDRQGRSDAYLHYHWHHMDPTPVRSTAALAAWLLRLATYRLVPGRRRAPTDEGMALQEMKARRRMAAHREMLQLRGTPRRYKQLSHEMRRDLSPIPGPITAAGRAAGADRVESDPQGIADPS